MSDILGRPVKGGPAACELHGPRKKTWEKRGAATKEFVPGLHAVWFYSLDSSVK